MLIQVSLELCEARGVARKSNGLHLAPSIRVALGIENRERTRGRDVLAVTHVDADVDPLSLDDLLFRIAG